MANTKEEIRDIIKSKYKTNITTIEDITSIEAEEYDELTKFPELKQVLVDLLTPEYGKFLASLDWVAPRPTTFRVNLKNDQNFYLIYGKRSWIAQVEGKKYYLLNLPEEERAAESISNILRYGSKEVPSEDNEGFEDMTAPPEETPPAETPPEEETPAEETPISEVFKKTNLEELQTTAHWDQRTNERGTILDITNFPNDYPLSKQEVSKKIEDELIVRATRLEKVKDLPLSLPYQIGYKLFKPLLNYNGQNVPLNLKVEYTVKGVKKIGTGNSFLAIIDDNTLTTLMLLPQDNDASIELNMADHMERKFQEKKIKKKKPIKILTAPSNYEFIISPPTSTESSFIDPNSLPYKLRTDYRKGADFEHNDYGKGKVVDTSAGSSGKGDNRGKLDWVEVDFGKPYLAGGQLKKTRIIKNIYTLVSPDLNTRAAE
jgi:hypothetical protein